MARLMARRGRSEQYVLTLDQRRALVDAARGSTRDYFIVVSMLYCGLTTSEVAHCRRVWLRLPEWELVVPVEQPCGCGGCLAKRGGIWRPKSESGARSVPIGDILRAPVYGFLSAHPEGVHMHRTAIWRQVKFLATRAKIRMPGLAGDTVFSQALRATCARMLAEGGMDAPRLQYLMGWSKPDEAEQHVRATQTKAGAAL